MNSVSAEGVNLLFVVLIILVPALGSQAAHDHRAWLVLLPYAIVSLDV